LSKTCHRAGFTPKVLQNVDLERTMIHAISAGLGVALVPEQLKKLPQKNVVFRPVMPAVATEACVAWKGENPSAPRKLMWKSSSTLAGASVDLRNGRA
jgi:DNA-binding transcriptional LysR family regulator